MTKRQIACIAHEVNRAYCAAVGDTSHPTWHHAPEWQQESTINGVNLHLQSSYDVTPEASHEAWLMEKSQAGWIWGPIKNIDLKEHPAIMPYEELPLFEKVKDHLFKAVIDALRAEVAIEQDGDAVIFGRQR